VLPPYSMTTLLCLSFDISSNSLRGRMRVTCQGGHEGQHSQSSAPLEVLHKLFVRGGADFEHLHRDAAATPHSAVPAAGVEKR
jgi:hypothetical protein